MGCTAKSVRLYALAAMILLALPGVGCKFLEDRQEEVPPLVGTWRLTGASLAGTEYSGARLPGPIDYLFDTDVFVGVRSLCGTLSGQYSVQGTNLQLNDLSAHELAHCTTTSEPVTWQMKFEAAHRAVLAEVSRFSVAGDEMMLIAIGDTLLLEASENPDLFWAMYAVNGLERR